MQLDLMQQTDSIKKASFVIMVIFIVNKSNKQRDFLCKAKCFFFFFFFHFSILTSIFRCLLITSTFKKNTHTHTITLIQECFPQCLKGDVKQSSRHCGGQWRSSRSPSGKVSLRSSPSPSRPPVPPYHRSDSL